MRKVFQIEELVEVLDRQTIEKLYGVDSFGDLDTPHGIVEQMESALGNKFKIKSIDSDDLGKYAELEGYETWRFDLDLLRRITPRPNDTVIVKSWEQFVEEFGEDAIWYDEYGEVDMIKVGESNFRRDMCHLSGKKYIVPEEAELDDLHIHEDWYINKDMVYVVDRPIPKMTLADIEVGKPIPEELVYQPKLKEEYNTPTPYEPLDFTPLEEPKVELINTPKEVTVFDGAIEFNGISISGKEIQITFK